MSEVFHAGDLHFGHENIIRFRPNIGGIQVTNEEEHREAVIQLWNETVSKKDTVWIHGDAIFKECLLWDLRRLNGNKNLILGNHDVSLKDWYGINKVCGFERYKSTWLSHAPIHPAELRGKVNIHGHVHYATIRTDSGDIDRRYFNVSLENINGRPISHDAILEFCKNE